MLPNVILADGFGSSETGAQGSSASAGARTPRPAAFAKIGAETTVVLGPTTRPMQPGSGDGRAGRHRRHSRCATTTIPRRRRPRSSSSTESAGSSPATWPPSSADGTITLLGRGRCRSTPAARRSSPRRSSRCSTATRRSTTCWSSACPTSAGGARCRRRRARVRTAPTLEELVAHCREQLAGYKLPKRLVLVDRVVRSPSGKADYAWAADTAAKATVSD